MATSFVCSRSLYSNNLNKNIRIYRWKEIFHSIIFYGIRYQNSNAASVDEIEKFTRDLINNKNKIKDREIGTNNELNNIFHTNSYYIKYHIENNMKNIAKAQNINMCVDISILSKEQISSLIENALNIRNLVEVTDLLKSCEEHRKFPSKDVIMELFTYYSDKGDLPRVNYLKDFCLSLNPNIYKFNCKFDHYLAKTHCMKGNTDKGLNIFVEVYKENKLFRGIIRNMLFYVINDTVANRSEASLVVLRRHVEMFSSELKDHVPLACFWQSCWLSTWFNDQQLADDLMDRYESLKQVLKEKSTMLAIKALRLHNNEDAVTRLLQLLLKYNYMEQYTSVLQVLFDYKLNTRDLRGCTEILRNCEVLGVTLTTVQRGRYIRMLINQRPSYKF